MRILVTKDGQQRELDLLLPEDVADPFLITEPGYLSVTDARVAARLRDVLQVLLEREAVDGPLFEIVFDDGAVMRSCQLTTNTSGAYEVKYDAGSNGG